MNNKEIWFYVKSVIQVLLGFIVVFGPAYLIFELSEKSGWYMFLLFPWLLIGVACSLVIIDIIENNKKEIDRTLEENENIAFRTIMPERSDLGQI